MYAGLLKFGSSYVCSFTSKFTTIIYNNCIRLKTVISMVSSKTNKICHTANDTIGRCSTDYKFKVLFWLFNLYELWKQVYYRLSTFLTWHLDNSHLYILHTQSSQAFPLPNSECSSVDKPIVQGTVPGKILHTDMSHMPANIVSKALPSS